MFCYASWGSKTLSIVSKQTDYNSVIYWPYLASCHQGLSKSESEIVRLIGQYLRNIGLRNSAAVLMTEAGCQQDHTIAASFRKHVMTGEWSSAVTREFWYTHVIRFISGVGSQRFLLPTTTGFFSKIRVSSTGFDRGKGLEKMLQSNSPVLTLK